MVCFWWGYILRGRKSETFIFIKFFYFKIAILQSILLSYLAFFDKRHTISILVRVYCFMGDSIVYCFPHEMGPKDNGYTYNTINKINLSENVK